MSWLSRWFAPRRNDPSRPGHREPVPAVPPTPTAAARRPSVVAADAAAAVQAPPDPAGDPPPAFLCWLLGCGAPLDRPLSEPERRALAALDDVLRAPVLPDALLPRAAALVPQLLAMLRQTALPVPALAQRVAQDPALAAEVLRLASSPFYRAQGAVGDLAQAIQLVGQRGLEQCIARIVLKPIYAGPGGSTSVPVVRLWAYSEVLGAAAAAAAAERGIEPFDGYLVGLLHGSGWLIASRAMARAGMQLTVPPCAAFAAAIEARAHALFGRAARGWSITPGLTAFAADAERSPLGASAHPMAAALRAAMPAAMQSLVGAESDAPAGAAPPSQG